ncbi:dihydrofolate reductase family protein [Nocardiopsis sp. NRRL B-16309]|uniref:dihydrofolate reductase family protein n=1 Tax=Nocardiopsis sp. NRRL B-16309 TaxID=1519494 RepID=UPI0006AEBBBA|nr:dihydrofolate reductase family protein [Nocardiopsis sp. NRRL B-16309]KOX23615.1 deaminase [Nocardiopsis sp. NRRL B-16309]
MRTLTYVVAVSLDGFVCAPDGSFDFFPHSQESGAYHAREIPELIPTHVRERLGVDAPNRRFDTMIQGRRSYQVALDEGVTSPYAHMRQYVLSRSLPHDTDPDVTVVGTDPLALVRALKREEGALGLCLVGGPTAAGVLLPEIDELMIKRYPVIAGAGRPFFDGAAFTPAAFERVRGTVLDDGADYTLFRRTAPAPE